MNLRVRVLTTLATIESHSVIDIPSLDGGDVRFFSCANALLEDIRASRDLPPNGVIVDLSMGAHALDVLDALRRTGSLHGLGFVISAAPAAASPHSKEHEDFGHRLHQSVESPYPMLELLALDRMQFRMAFRFAETWSRRHAAKPLEATFVHFTAVDERVGEWHSEERPGCTSDEEVVDILLNGVSLRAVGRIRDSERKVRQTDLYILECIARGSRHGLPLSAARISDKLTEDDDVFAESFKRCGRRRAHVSAAGVTNGVSRLRHAMDMVCRGYRTLIRSVDGGYLFDLRRCRVGLRHLKP